MIESMFNPRRLEKGPWKMLFIGILYASLSLILVKWFFAGDVVLSQYSGMIVVTFCVMLTLPFMYFVITEEEAEDEEVFGFFGVWRIHKDAIYSFLWLFLGFIIAFSFWYIVLQDSNLFNAQIETFCRINSPGDLDKCVDSYSFNKATGAAVKEIRLLSIIENNVYVMIFTLILSLIFGAGAIFVQNSIADIPLGVLRYMVHGFPEVAAYFIAALAGGIFGVGVVRNGFKSDRFVHVVENTVVLLFIALAILIAAAIMEVYFTPLIFS